LYPFYNFIQVTGCFIAVTFWTLTFSKYYVVSLTLLVFAITLTILSLFLFVALANEEQNIEMTKPAHIPSASQHVEPMKPTQALLGAPKTHAQIESSQSGHEIIRTHMAPTEIPRPLPDSAVETVVNIPIVILYSVFTMFFVALKVCTFHNFLL
jgi:hypothetical protein